LKIPDAFTPNGDGINDVFRIVNSDFFEDIEMKIYNRWGEMVHYGRDNNHGWDGTYKLKEQEIGLYIFYVTAKSTFSGDVVNLIGNVSLIR
jgi:gliding motility-associated-like protein